MPSVLLFSKCFKISMASSRGNPGGNAANRHIFCFVLSLLGYGIREFQSVKPLYCGELGNALDFVIGLEGQPTFQTIYDCLENRGTENNMISQIPAESDTYFGRSAAGFPDKLNSVIFEEFN